MNLIVNVVIINVGNMNMDLWKYEPAGQVETSTLRTRPGLVVDQGVRPTHLAYNQNRSRPE